MLEGHYTPRAPRIQVAGGAVRRRLALRAAPSGDDQVLDLSGDGMKLLAAQPLSPGDVLDVELAHPALRGALALSASVQWARPSAVVPGRVEAGLRFDCMRDTTRVALEQVIVAELGSQIVCHGRGPVGWIAAAGPVQGAEVSYFVYDLEQREVASLLEVEAAFRVTRRQTPYDPREFETLEGALGWSLDQRPELLEVAPPLLPSSGGSSHATGRP